MDLDPLSLSIELTSEAAAGRVVVRNQSESTTAVWNLGNEWGDNSLSFEIQGEVLLRVVRKLQDYTRNVPSAVELSAGESHAWDFDLNDGTWELGEQSGWGAGAKLVAIYETVASDEASTANVWIGRVVSEPVSLVGPA